MTIYMVVHTIHYEGEEVLFICNDKEAAISRADFYYSTDKDAQEYSDNERYEVYQYFESIPYVHGEGYEQQNKHLYTAGKK